jgi:signal transduction histidine kinase
MPNTGLKFEVVPPDPDSRAEAQEKSRRSLVQFMELKVKQDYSERLSAISHFTTEIAHHLNNSLTPIICYAQMLQQAQHTPQQAKKLQRITEAAAKAKEIIDGLVAFAEGQPARALPVDLNRIAQETIPVAEDLIWLPKDRVKMESSPEPLTVIGDPHQISQMLLHLLKNAMQASPGEAKEITLRTALASDGRAVIEVEDHGEGIPAEILPKILLPFFTTRDGEGIGMGLSIVHGIAEAHGAELEVFSEVGKGTTVQLLFPRMETVDSGDTK